MNFLYLTQYCKKVTQYRKNGELIKKSESYDSLIISSTCCSAATASLHAVNFSIQSPLVNNY